MLQYPMMEYGLADKSFKKIRVLQGGRRLQSATPVGANIAGNSVFSISLKPFARLSHRPSIRPSLN
jgi:hypothetical protein